MSGKKLFDDSSGVDYEDLEAESKPGFFRRLFRTLILTALLIVLALGGWSMYAYTQIVEKKPWEWSGENWKGYWEHTRTLGTSVGTEVVQKSRQAGQKAVELGGQAYESVKNVEWSKIGNRISSKTQELFGKTDEVAKQIDDAQKAVKADDGGYAPKFAGPAGENYDYGLQWLEKGVAEWKVSVSESQNETVLNAKATERAKKFFEKAVASFEEAKKADASLPDVDKFLTQAKDFLADSTERQQKIEELMRSQPAPGAPEPSGTMAPAAEPVPTAAAPNG